MAAVFRICVIVLMPLVVWGGTSADYSLSPVVFDGGGAIATSEGYAVNPSSSFGAAGASADYILRGGFAGQIYDILSIAIDESAPSLIIGERATRQLVVAMIYDDASRLPLAANQVTWAVVSGPLAGIDSGGIATAASVYQNGVAVARATYQSFTDTAQFTVANTGRDDFDSYAADGLEDGWQVRYFGETSAFGGPNSNLDSDGSNNLQEFAFGTDPTQSSSASVLWTGATLGATGLPVPFASRSQSGFSFRAVFSRRRDFAVFGLRYAVEFSGDLVTWRASTATPSVLADDGEFQVVSVPYPFFVNGRKATFFRVKVQSQ
jgi:hypothetical protein